jgi:hypothetical protein
LKSRLLVSETLKGEADSKGVFLYHWVWNGGAQLDQIKPGQKLLLFLDRLDKSDGYQISYAEYALKTPTDSELKVYRQRIAEMSVIMRQNPPDTGDLVEWLVRCAEDPATRWEGAYELANTVRYADEDGKASPNASGETQDNVTATTTAVATAPSAANTVESTPEQVDIVVTDAQPVIVTDAQIRELPLFRLRSNVISNARLTVEQKNRLLDALYNSQSVDYGEFILLDWTKDWDDARLVPFLLSQLHRIKDNPDYYAEQMMSLLAAKVGDNELVKLAEEYSVKARYTDEVAEAETAPEENAESADSSVEEETSSEEPPAEATDNVDAAAQQSEEAATADAATENTEVIAPDEDQDDKRTAAQKRSARLQKFLAAVELTMQQQMARKW